MPAFAPNVPSGIAQSALQRQLLSDLQLLKPHYNPFFIKKYGNESYTLILDMLGLKKQITGRDFFHYETYGKLHQKITVNTDVTGITAGADVIVTLSAADHYSSGTVSPIRTGEVVKIDSSGLEGRIISVNTTTPNAHTATIRPLKTGVPFTSAGSSSVLSSGEVLKLMGATDIGENSSQLNSITNLTDKVSNTTTEIRDDWTITDRAMIEELQFEYNGQPYFKYKGMDESARRFLNSREFKLIFGDTANNLSAYGGSVGTQGLLSQINSGGQVVTYTPGLLNISKLHEITRGLNFYGGAEEYHWLCDIYQRQELDDQLFQAYGNAILWNYVGGDAQTAIGYGFSSVQMDGYNLHIKNYKGFNSEAVWGAASANSQYRNYGILIPMKMGSDPVTQNQMHSVSLVWNSPNNQEILVKESGLWSSVGVPNVSNLTVTHLGFYGIEVFARNQFMIVTH